MTLKLTFWSLGLGLILALPFSFGQVYGGRIAKGIIVVYERLFRSIPLLVILFLIFYGFPKINVRFSPFTACILGLGLRSAAYQSQIFRGAIQSVSETQMRAARSLGMSRLQASDMLSCLKPSVSHYPDGQTNSRLFSKILLWPTRSVLQSF